MDIFATSLAQQKVRFRLSPESWRMLLLGPLVAPRLLLS